MSSSAKDDLGQQRIEDTGSDFNAQSFLIGRMISKTATTTLVQVKAVTNAGGISPVGFVDVQPMINQLDGYGSATPHGVIHDIPYVRLQGGANAVILDPQVGDIGLCVFAREDISSVKATKAVANPGSGRRNSMADGLYIGGVLNGTPTQYVVFDATGITVKSPTKVTIDAPNVVITGSVAITGSALTHNSKNVGSTHTHGGVQSGASNTGVPT